MYILTTHKAIKTITKSLRGILGGLECMNNDLKSLKCKIDSIDNEYTLRVLKQLIGYYSTIEMGRQYPPDRMMEIQKTIDGINTVYCRIVVAQSFIDKIIILIGYIKEWVVDRKDINKRNKSALMHKLNSLVGMSMSTMIIEKANTTKCPNCGERWNISSDHAEASCTGCGLACTVVGIGYNNTDDKMMNEMIFKRSTAHNWQRHYKDWIKRIQALEQKEIDSHVETALKYCIFRDGVHHSKITYNIVRDYLKECKFTRYNDHISLLITALGGPMPPRLTYEEDERISAKFNRLMELYNSIPNKGVKKPYYPYFIYKIIEAEFTDVNDGAVKLLGYIHLQSRATVTKNDNIYRDICAMADPKDNFTYKPTDMAKMLV